jgi:hypothetical protein
VVHRTGAVRAEPGEQRYERYPLVSSNDYDFAGEYARARTSIAATGWSCSAGWPGDRSPTSASA